MASISTLSNEDIVKIAEHLRECNFEKVDKSNKYINKLLEISDEYMINLKKKEELECLTKEENELQEKLKEVQMKKDKLTDKVIVNKPLTMAQIVSTTTTTDTKSTDVLTCPYAILKAAKQPEEIYNNFPKNILNDEELNCLYICIKVLICALWILEQNDKSTEKVNTFLQECISIATVTCNIEGPVKQFSTVPGCHNPYCDNKHYNGISATFRNECTFNIDKKCTNKSCTFRHISQDGKLAIQYTEWYFNSKQLSDTDKTMKFVSNMIGFKGIIPKF